MQDRLKCTAGRTNLELGLGNADPDFPFSDFPDDDILRVCDKPISKDRYPRNSFVYPEDWRRKGE